MSDTSQILGNKRLQIKSLTVRPGQKLSRQKHFHRGEHWLVVTGSAFVELENELTGLRENESIYIPRGTTYRLINPGRGPLVLARIVVEELDETEQNPPWFHDSTPRNPHIKPPSGMKSPRSLEV